MRNFLFAFLIVSSIASIAQDTDILLNHDLNHYIDRLDIKGHTHATLHTDLKPYGREALTAAFDRLRLEPGDFTPNEQGWNEQMRFLVDDELAVRDTGRGFLKTFYKNKRDIVFVNKPGFRLFVNPVWHTSPGIDQNNYPRAVEENLPIYFNTRGLVLRGTLFGKLGFHTEVFDNVTRLPQYQFNTYMEQELFYGEGFVKRFGDKNGLDYLGSRGYLTYSPWKGLRIKFGKDRVFWGNGYQSLLLSDFSPDQLMLNITARVWKFEYVSHFAQMIHFIQNKNDTEGTFPRKYGAFHQLSYKPNAKLSIGFFESVIYSPTLPNGQRGVELQYFNPIIFFRTVEQYIGSPDNSVLGLHAKYNLLNKVQVYGQFLLDDFDYSKRNEGSGYWGNKTGFQLGAKYIDAFGISTLDLQAEYNRIRPYTYQHFTATSNYSHYGQHLGHAAGANLFDYHLIARYHPFPAWNVYVSYSFLQKGLDGEDELNYGGDIQRSFVNRPGDFDQTVGQGQLTTVQSIFGRISYQLLKSDSFIELEGRYRKQDELSSTSILFGLRSSISPRLVKW